MKAVLPACLERGTRIVSNQGWINPEGAAQRVVHWLREFGARGVKVAAVGGSLITGRVLELTDRIMENGEPTSTPCREPDLGRGLPRRRADCGGAEGGRAIVVTGRAADPSIFMAPMMHEFGWDPLDHARVGREAASGTCSNAARRSPAATSAIPASRTCPIPGTSASRSPRSTKDGSAVITKVDGTGGAVNLMTVKEQLLYEVHDPANYITPDVVVDFTTTKLEQVGPDRVRVSRISGKPRTPTYKVSISCAEGFIGEDMFFYAGPGALRRAQLAKRILEERFRIVGLQAEEVRIDFLGMNAIHGVATPERWPEPYEIAVRVAARTRTREEALKVGARSTAWRSRDSAYRQARSAPGPHARSRSACGRRSLRASASSRPSPTWRAEHASQAAARCSRTLGRQGQHANMAVFAYDPELYPLLKAQLTAARVKEFYRGAITGEIERYEVDGLHALNFVAHGALGGGVSRSLCLDNYGKALSAALLGFELEIPEALRGRLRDMK
jgi:hypothetical protein